METEKFEKTPRKANRWFRAFVVLALLFGATFSLNSVFNWIFFFGAAYSFFMSYYLLPMQPKIFQGSQNRQRQSRPWQNQDQSYRNEAEVVSPVERSKKIAIIIASSIFGLFFFLMVIGFLVGDPEEDVQSSGQEQSYEPVDNSAAALVSRGNDFFNNQEYDSADVYYDKALVLDGGYMEAIYGKGIVLYQQGRIDEANTAFLRAYEGGFRYAWLSWVLADMYDKQGQTSRAADFYKESVKLDSSYVDSYKRLAELEPGNSDKYLKLAQKYSSN